MISRRSFFKAGAILGGTTLLADEPSKELENWHPKWVDIQDELQKTTTINDPYELENFINFDTKNRIVSFSGDFNFTTRDLYSYSKEAWKNDRNLIKFPFSISAITPELFELQDDWTFDQSVYDYATEGTIMATENGEQIVHTAIILLGHGTQTAAFRVKDGFKTREYRDRFFLEPGETLTFKQNYVDWLKKEQYWKDIDPIKEWVCMEDSICTVRLPFG